MIRVHHLDELALLGPNPKELPQELLDAKMGFRSNGSQEQACASLFERGFYQLAATVDSDDLDEAWELTNHIDQSWTLNPRCRAEPGPQRSSSVGDLFEDASGRLHVCASVGFRPMPSKPRAPKP